MQLSQNRQIKKHISLTQTLGTSETGAISVIFGLSLAILIGTMALMIDVARVFTVKSHLVNFSESTALAVARNLNFLADGEIDDFATDIASSMARNTSVFTFGGGPFATTTTVVTASGKASVTIKTAVPTTLLRFFSLSDDINVSQTVTAYQYAPDAEIAIVLESSQEMQQSGKMNTARAAVKEFIGIFAGHSKLKSGATFGFIPFGSKLMNVAPHTEWLEAGSWPTEIPPNVPGTTGWNGDLADDRWCILRRSGVAGQSDLTPAQSPFQLELDIQKQEEGGGIPHYANITSSDCRHEPIFPIADNTNILIQSVSSLSGNGGVYAGWAMVWAERLLSPLWQSFWQTRTGTPASYENEAIQKVVILIVGSSNTEPGTEDILFQNVCDRLKSKGVTIYVVDYLAPESISGLLTGCATTTGHYFRADNDKNVSEALYAIAKFLTVVRFSG
ncbi:Tad domain-containing protein [Sneathiella marina]|uniref:Tad domain-containing protein n=1 Tax=Sneathiella marina TaxID=2950108 RepID=A0ABY4W788_9PROT|nr:Tad domain-containing protein [Sneathiella marina]USG63045.1 Tad domain-containing protein [Sneathiella marina]